MEKSWKKSRKSHGMSWNLSLKIVWEPCTNHPCDLHQWSSWHSQTQSVCWWLQRWEPGLLCDSQQPWAASWPKLSSQLLLSLVECWHCCDWKSRTACAQSFSLWQQTTIEITWRDHSYCLFAPYIYIYIYIVLLRAHSVCGESYIQRNTAGDVATTSPSFYNKPHWSHVLFVKTELGTTSTSWSQHHFVAIRNPVRHVRKSSHWQQATIEITWQDHSIIACSRHIYIYIVLFRAHPVRGESHIQRNTTGEIATAPTRIWPSQVLAMTTDCLTEVF